MTADTDTSRPISSIDPVILVAADFVPEYTESSGNADAMYTMCQDKEEKHIHVDSITLAESDQRDYKERHSEYISWKNQRTNSFQNMMCLLGSVKECDMFNSDDTAGDQLGYYFSRARPPDEKETYVRRGPKNLGVHILARDWVGPAISQNTSKDIWLVSFRT
jgi:hypothetical protein